MAKFRKGEKMKDNIGKALICLVLLLICGVMAALFGMLVADFVQAVKNKPEQPQTYNDVTFEVIDTYDSAGNNLIYDTATGIVYKGGYSVYKPYYSEDGYLYIYRDGRLQEVR